MGALKNTYDLDNKDLFWFLQVRRYLNKTKTTFSQKHVCLFFRVTLGGASLGRDTSCQRKCGTNPASSFWLQFKNSIDKVRMLLLNNFETLYLGVRTARLVVSEKKYIYSVLLLLERNPLLGDGLLKIMTVIGVAHGLYNAYTYIMQK